MTPQWMELKNKTSKRTAEDELPFFVATFVSCPNFTKQSVKAKTFLKTFKKSIDKSVPKWYNVVKIKRGDKHHEEQEQDL